MHCGYAVDIVAIILTCHNNDNNDFQSIVLVYENVFLHIPVYSIGSISQGNINPHHRTNFLIPLSSYPFQTKFSH